MTKVIVSGGFHNSDEITILFKNNRLSIGQYKRLERHFCGIDGCVCGAVSRADIEGIPHDIFMNAVENAMYEAWNHS